MDKNMKDNEGKCIICERKIEKIDAINERALFLMVQSLRVEANLHELKKIISYLRLSIDRFEPGNEVKMEKMLLIDFKAILNKFREIWPLIYSHKSKVYDDVEYISISEINMIHKKLDNRYNLKSLLNKRGFQNFRFCIKLKSYALIIDFIYQLILKFLSRASFEKIIIKYGIKDLRIIAEIQIPFVGRLEVDEIRWSVLQTLAKLYESQVKFFSNHQIMKLNLAYPISEIKSGRKYE